MVRYDIAPPIEISVTPSFALIRDWEESREATFVARLRNRTPGRLAGALWVVPLALILDSYEPAHVEFAGEDDEVTVRLKVKLPILKPPMAPDILVEFRREKPAPPSPLASLKIPVLKAGFDVTSGTTIGLIRGPNSQLLTALSQLGVDASEVALDEVLVQDHGDASGSAFPGCSELSRFDSIVIDNSAYSVRQNLGSANRCLLDYVRRGGNLVVLGQTSDNWNAQSVQTGLAPFPIKLSGSESSQPLKILAGVHVLMSQPNKMEEKDFDSWIVKGFAAEWAQEYTSVLGPADSSQSPGRSALLVARVGDGTYIYSSFDLSDQLRARNPRAYKFLANLISAKRPRKIWNDDWN